MKLYVMKNRRTGQVANVTADSRAAVLEWLVWDKGWKSEDVMLVEERRAPGCRP